MRSLSIKLGVILLVIGLTICSDKVWGEDWQELAHATTGVFYFDKANIRTTSEGNIRVWIHNMTKLKTYLIELNCKGKSYKVLDSIEYDEAYRVKSRETSYDNPDWLNNEPKSIPESLQNIFCP